MVDISGNGWEGNVIGFKQNGVIVGTFGENFTWGSSSGPVSVLLRGDIETKIVVKKLGRSTN